MVNGPVSPALKHVLITQAHMIRYGGSEMVTMELAQEFARRGVRVTIATGAYGPPLSDVLSHADMITLRHIDDWQLHKSIASDPPQICWVHHQLLPPAIFQHMHDCYFIFNHMSSYHVLEQSWSPKVERGLGDISLYNSPETKESHRSNILTRAFEDSKIRIFPNPAPDGFRMQRDDQQRHEGDFKLGIISNHAPPEVLKLLEQTDLGIRVELIGQGGSPRIVTPEAVNHLDAILSIGKSVQYGLVAGIPVYCYDHFGGPGWLTEENFEVAAHMNFSGRGFGKKTESEIAAELVHGFAAAACFARDTASQDKKIEQYLLSAALDNLLAGLWGSGERRDRTLTWEDIHSHIAQQRVFLHYLRNWLKATRQI